MDNIIKIADVSWLHSIPVRYLAQLKQWQTWQVPCEEAKRFSSGHVKFHLGMVRIYDSLSLSLSLFLSFFPSFLLSFLPSLLPSFLLSFSPFIQKTNLERENDDFQTKYLNIWGSFIVCCILVLGSAPLQQYPTTGFWTYMKARQYQ